MNKNAFMSASETNEKAEANKQMPNQGKAMFMMMEMSGTFCSALTLSLPQWGTIRRRLPFPALLLGWKEKSETWVQYSGLFGSCSIDWFLNCLAWGGDCGVDLI